MGAAGDAAWLEALDELAAETDTVEVVAPIGAGHSLGGGGSGDQAESAVTLTPTEAPIVDTTPIPALDTSLQLTEERFESLLDQAGFDRATWAAAKTVAACESKWSPNATGGAGERGTFQIHPIHRDSTYDELGNFVAAYRISSGGYDWSAWACRPG